jgi:hypothetical protein
MIVHEARAQRLTTLQNREAILEIRSMTLSLSYGDPMRTVGKRAICPCSHIVCGIYTLNPAPSEMLRCSVGERTRHYLSHGLHVVFEARVVQFDTWKEEIELTFSPQALGHDLLLC